VNKQGNESYKNSSKKQSNNSSRSGSKGRRPSVNAKAKKKPTKTPIIENFDPLY
jgi:hypothetical protein